MLPVSRMPAELPSYHDLSKRGRQRLSWIDFYFAHGKNASLTRAQD
jgi:hypothetical protein